MAILPDLKGGGAERVATTIFTNFGEGSNQVTILTLKPGGVYAEEMSKFVNVHCLRANRVRFAMIKVLKYLRQDKPDVVFCFNVNNLNLLVAPARIFLPKSHFVTREATILGLSLKKYPVIISGLLKLLHRFAFKSFDTIVSLSTGMREDLVSTFKVSRDRIHLINNPVDIARVRGLSEASIPYTGKPDFVYVGRLVERKGLHSILHALNRLDDKNCRLVVVGKEAPEEPDYQIRISNLVDELGIEDQVEFVGFQANPYPYIASAGALIMASDFEGFPNVALEANALGVPVLSFRSPGGIRDIIQDDLNGWLVPQGDIGALASGMKVARDSRLSSDKIMRVTEDRYKHVKIVDIYRNLLLTSGFEQ